MTQKGTLESNPLISIEVLEGLHDGAYHWALSQCQYHALDAEDVLQRAYIQVLSGKAIFKGQSSLKIWWYSVIRNTARGHIRYWKTQARFLADQYTFNLYRESNSDSQLTEGELSQEQSNQYIMQQLRALPQRQRDMIELVFYREMTIEEAAAVINVTVGTARVHYERAKKNLRQKLAGERPYEK